MKIKNRIEQFQFRKEIPKYEKISIIGTSSNIVKNKKKKLYDYYKCDYCKEEIRLDVKTAERSGGTIEIPDILTRRGKLKLALCNKCLKKVLEEFEEENYEKENNKNN